jgi:hypothetical protein
MGFVDAPMSSRLLLFPLFLSILPVLALPPGGTCDVPPESLRVVVATIDGIRRSECFAWNEGLVAWADTNGAYLADVRNLTRGITDPNHAVLWGSGDPQQCSNREGHPADPMHFELLCKERDLRYGSTVIVTGKSHLMETNRYSAHPEYGVEYAAVPILVRTPPPPCMEMISWYEGPDSCIVHAAIDYLAENDVVWMGLNLSEYDFLSHAVGMDCANGDTLQYWWRLQEVYDEAEHLLLRELWPFLQSHPRYAGKTVLLIATDHGRHLDNVAGGFLGHGHGWLPDSTGCAMNCTGCRDGWAVFAGPGVRPGAVANCPHYLEDLPATVRALMGFGNPYETGSVIEEILCSVPTGVASAEPVDRAPGRHASEPNPFHSMTSIRYLLDQTSSVRLGVYDVEGREVYAEATASTPAGMHAFVWEGRDRSGRRVAPGVYLYSLEARGLRTRGKVLLLP